MIYPQGSVGLGILSWRGHASLKQSLISYKKEDFFSLFDEAMIFLPDPDDDVQKVCKNYPLRIEKSSVNNGIMAGMEEIANRLKTDYIFFTENDCPLIESRTETERQIRKALELLKTKNVCMARMRHVVQPGEKFTTLNKYKWMHPSPDNFVGRLRRVFRPEKAHRVSGTAIYAEQSPHKRFPNTIQDAGEGFYLVDTDTLPKSVPLGRTANGFRTLEIELNRSKFWTQSGWKIACGPGILTHKRANDRGY